MPKSKAVRMILNPRASQPHTCKRAGRPFRSLGQVNHFLHQSSLKVKKPGSAMSMSASQGMGRSFLASCKRKVSQSVIQVYKAATCTVIRSLPPHLEIKCKHMHMPKCCLRENHYPDNAEWEQEGKKNKKIQTNICAFPVSFSLLSEAPSHLIKHCLGDKE